jgi:hypothetical protein
MTLPDLNFIVTIDVEEDNWGYDYAEFTLENIRMIPRIQSLLDQYGIKPTYLVSYHVACCNWAVDILAKILSENKCEIGSHLHPWTTPPVTEVINEINSMLKNLPYELQAAKLTTLTRKIADAFGERPRSFRAGRWGLGLNTIKALVDCGYRVDSSVTPTISWKQDGDGPNYPEVRLAPYWLSSEGFQSQDDDGGILEVPATIGFNRWPFELWQKVYLLLKNDRLSYFKLAGIMHRTGLLRKIWLSPEVSSANDMIALSRLMIKNNVHFLNLSFHSTTLLPGKSPFVQNIDDLDRFYLRIGKLLEYLTSATNLTSLTLSGVEKLYKKVNNDKSQGK